MARFRKGLLSAGDATGELHLSRSRFYVLYADFLRACAQRRQHSWVPGSSGGKHHPAWPGEVCDLLRKLLRARPPASYSFAASEVHRRHQLKLDRASVRRWALTQGLAPDARHMGRQGLARRHAEVAAEGAADAREVSVWERPSRSSSPCTRCWMYGKSSRNVSSSRNPGLQHIIQSKEAGRRRLRALPWLEKLELLDRLRERHLSLQQMQPRPARTRSAFEVSARTGRPLRGHSGAIEGTFAGETRRVITSAGRTTRGASIASNAHLQRFEEWRVRLLRLSGDLAFRSDSDNCPELGSRSVVGVGLSDKVASGHRKRLRFRFTATMTPAYLCNLFGRAVAKLKHRTTSCPT